MQVVGQFLAPRMPDTTPLDDVVITSRWAGVVDQSTPKQDYEHDLLGAFRMAVAALDGSQMTTAREVTDAVSAAVREVQDASGPRACLTFALVDVFQRRVIRVGDCHVVLGQRVLAGRNPVDEVLGPMRSLVTELACAHGDMTDSDDPGRSVILPWIGLADRTLRNHPTSRFGFGAIDGCWVPDRFVEEFAVGTAETVVAVMTDGYPRPSLRLEDAESALADVLRRDPTLAVFDTTKGCASGASSFDDRAFISVDVPEKV
jgi:hypothetical protein